MESKKVRISKKLEVFEDVIKSLSTLSNSSTLKVSCIALHKNFTKIASFGYNGSYAGAPINPLTGTEEDSLEPGKSGFIHAEVNMIAKFREIDPENYLILLSHSPCKMCSKILINSGFKYIFWISDYRDQSHLGIFDECGIQYGNFEYLKSNFMELIK